MTLTAGRDAIFPLVRLLSAPCTRFLIRLPVTPNQITLVSLALGLAASSTLLGEGRWVGVIAGVLLTASYVLDNCDGEVARAKGLSSAMGAQLDNLTDCLVHASLFTALGLAETRADANPVPAYP